MPIQLTTPYKLGRETYPQADIVSVEKIFLPTAYVSTTIRVQYGNTVDGQWVAGKADIKNVLIQDTPAKLGGLDENGIPIEIEPVDPKHSDWVASTTPTSTSNLLDAEILTALYTFLITQPGLEGTIV